ncbi:hypothetical protein [Oceanirhabdus sp. W0125-5]|uniref:hypothetical protein n=1 Tax=Oceanirhabdus sp. W0125-5 TaxID=2999116 RepID=UPI0022F32538|nr:hypothetical protein [Oceanirhabdus sp. W0125-5]WBW96303.1 hypothetical protein OW730_21805 [Oceanirhabdus sp. W0125-5]
MEILYEKVKKLFNIYILSVFVIYISIFGSIAFKDYKSSLVVAVVIGILSIPAYLIGKKVDKYRIVNPILNSIAIGLSVGALYSYCELSLRFINIVIPILIIVDLIFANKLIMRNLRSYKWIMLINVLIAIGAVIGAFILWNTNKILSIQIIFLSLTHISYFSGVFLLKKDKSDLWFILSITYFLAFVVIFILVICFIFEAGDGFLEAFFDIEPPSKKKAKRNNQI